ncbi:MAG TPA: MFS transporter [bacterium]|nr:MFS transporter [bacterium]
MPSKTRHDPYAALRSRDFRFYVITNFLVILGAQMVSMAVGWQLYHITGSALNLGLVGLFQVLPYLALGLFAGNVADRHNRRWIVVLTTLPYVAGLGGLLSVSLLAGKMAHFEYGVFGCLLFMSVANTFYIPAKQSLLPELVPRRDLPNAVTWSSGSFQVAAVTGPALCGWILEHFSYSTVYWLDMVFEVFFAVIVLGFQSRPKPLKKEPITLKSVGDGARFVWHTKPILATITIDLFAVLLGGCTALMPIFVKNILHSGPQTMGWLLAAPSVGAFCMAMLLTRFPPLRRPGKALLGAVAGFGAATIVFGLSKSLWLSLAMMFIIGALDNISVIVRGSLVQVLTPDRLLGRVQAVNYLFINSSNQLGAFESGLIASLIGTVPSVVLGGIGSIAIVFGVSYLWPQVAQLKSLHRVN